MVTPQSGPHVSKGHL